MKNHWIYRVGIGEDEVSLKVLEKSGLKFSVVDNPKEKFISSVKSVLGKSYKRGASVLRDAPELFDCSSLVAWAAVGAGLAVPRISIDQYVYSKRISREELVPGDLIFVNTGKIIHTDGKYFSQVLGKEVLEEAIRRETLEYLPGTKVPEGVDHVGVYVGDDKVIHASKSIGVLEDSIEDSKFENIVGYGRILNDAKGHFVVEIPAERNDLRIRENLIKEIRGF